MIMPPQKKPGDIYHNITVVDESGHAWKYNHLIKVGENHAPYFEYWDISRHMNNDLSDYEGEKYGSKFVSEFSVKDDEHNLAEVKLKDGKYFDLERIGFYQDERLCSYYRLSLKENQTHVPGIKKDVLIMTDDYGLNTTNEIYVRINEPENPDGLHISKTVEYVTLGLLGVASMVGGFLLGKKKYD
jgi:hypothetical protein